MKEQVLLLAYDLASAARIVNDQNPEMSAAYKYIATELLAIYAGGDDE